MKSPFLGFREADYTAIFARSENQYSTVHFLRVGRHDDAH